MIDTRIVPLLPECARGISSEVNDSTSRVYPVAKIHQKGSGSNEFCLAVLAPRAHEDRHGCHSEAGPRDYL